MITRIELQNFKIFEEESFDLAPLTLFTGINGMGKSSVIQSLLLLKQSYMSKQLQYEQTVELENNSFVDLENCEELCNKKASPKTVGITLENSDQKSYTWLIDASSPEAKKATFNFSGDDSYKDEALLKESFQYITAERIGPRRSYDKIVTTKAYNTALGIQGEKTPSFIQTAISENTEIGIEALMHPSLKVSERNPLDNRKLLYTNINAWLGDILGRPITAKVSDEGKDKVRLTFSIKGGQGDDFSALQVGFGFSFSLPVIVAPLIAKPGDLIIIENPEAHLHPSAQSKIGMLLALAAENGVQVILETHSDHILNGIRVSVKKGDLSSKNTMIHFFSPNGKVHRHSFNIEHDGTTERWPEGFFDEWDNALTKLLED
jgi:predicted ATPase